MGLGIGLPFYPRPPPPTPPPPPPPPPTAAAAAAAAGGGGGGGGGGIRGVVSVSPSPQQPHPPSITGVSGFLTASAAAASSVVGSSSRSSHFSTGRSITWECCCGSVFNGIFPFRQHVMIYHKDVLTALDNLPPRPSKQRSQSALTNLLMSYRFWNVDKGGTVGENCFGSKLCSIASHVVPPMEGGEGLVLLHHYPHLPLLLLVLVVVLVVVLLAVPPLLPVVLVLVLLLSLVICFSIMLPEVLLMVVIIRTSYLSNVPTLHPPPLPRHPLHPPPLPRHPLHLLPLYPPSFRSLRSRNELKKELADSLIAIQVLIVKEKTKRRLKIDCYLNLLRI